MDLNAQKEQFSRAYVQAVAAVAGYSWSVPSVDDDSIDLTLSARGGGGTTRSPKLDLQLKCHALQTPTSTQFSFDLKIKNYDDLRDETIQVPRILIVVLVPDNIVDWLNHTEAELAMRRCGYWSSLRGAAPTTNKNTIAVPMDRSRQLTPQELAQIMQRIGSGGVP